MMTLRRTLLSTVSDRVLIAAAPQAQHVRRRFQTFGDVIAALHVDALTRAIAAREAAGLKQREAR